MAKEKSDKVRVKFLTSIGGEMSYQCGEVVELDAETANDLIEAGLAEKL